MKFFLKALIFLAISLPAFSQNYSVEGTIVDAKDNSPVIGATVRLIELPDSTVKGAIADRQGNFEVKNVGEGRYLLKVTSIGYSEYTRNLTVTNQSLQLGNIQLKEESLRTGEVEVIGKLPPAQQKGDTTELSAGAFKTNRDATTEDLVQKMPGVVMQDGKVQAQGEEVKRVLVDGKPFFGDDPNAALRNLPAEAVDKVQIFDQSGEQGQFTGFNSGTPTKTMNIITKPNMRNGQFGKIFGGYGDDNRYRAGTNLNIFNGVQRFSVIAQTNNVNEQNFAIEDLVGALGGGGGMGGRGGGNMMRGGMMGGNMNRGGGMMGGMGGGMSDFLVTPSGGITMSHALGLNYQDQWGKHASVSGSYFVNYGDNTAEQALFRQYVLPSDSGQTYFEDNLSDSKNINHRFNFKMDYVIDSMNSFMIRPRASFQQNDGSSIIAGRTQSGENPLNSINNNFSSNLTGLNLSNEFLYRLRFETLGRTFSANVTNGYTRSDGDNALTSRGAFFSNTALYDTLSQTATMLSNGFTNTSTLTYTEPFDTTSGIQLSYTNTYNLNESDRKTFDNSTGQNSLNSLLSNTFDNTYLAHAGGLGYRYQTQDFQAMADVSYQWARMNNDQTSPQEITVNRTFQNVLPSASIRYAISKDQNFRLFYRTRTNPPSVSQLQNVINNNNPVQLTRGNPDLVQDFQQNLFMHFSSVNIEKSTSFFAMIGGSYTMDYIANSTTTTQGDAATGRITITQPVNLDGYASARTFIMYGMPVEFLKSNLNFNLSGTFTRTPGLINDVVNYSNSPTAGFGMTVSSNISEDLDFTISSNTSYVSVINSLQEQLNNEYINQSSRLRLNWIFWEGFGIQTDLTHQFYSGLTQSFNDNYLLWNASFGKKFLADNQAEIKLSAFDILKQNNSIQRNISDVYIEDTRSNVLQRYFMLQFTYNIRNFKKAGE